MKKIIAAALLAALLLCACGRSAPAPEPTAAPLPTPTVTEPPERQDAEGAPAPDGGDASGASAAEEELLAILEELRTGKGPATAGYGLACASRAGRAADLFAEGELGAERVGEITEEYCSGLGEEERELMLRQIEGMVSAFASIRTEEGAGYLSDSGYEARHYPWDDPETDECFAAMLRAVGGES